VLNHEITNSVVPLHILSGSLLEQFHDGGQQISAHKIDDDVIDRMVLGLKTIEKRSGGLRDFVQAYQSFTDMGEAVYSRIRISEMFDQVRTLLADELSQSGIRISMEVVPNDLQLLADEKLVEQTLINLLKNSIFALEKSEHPEITLKAFQDDEQVSIEVRDNGKGIPDEIVDNIFTPFFTTRKEGSGIGLSLARQVMLMHNGSIHATSLEGEYTTFSLSF
jgi:signal transduction histidine kinase